MLRQEELLLHILMKSLLNFDENQIKNNDLKQFLIAVRNGGIQ